MQAETFVSPDWRDSAAYAPLLDADRSMFAWEWLRRDPAYRAAADRAQPKHGPSASAGPVPAAFGLVAFEAPRLAVPHARPLWRSDVHPFVLPVAPSAPRLAADAFDLERVRGLARLVVGDGADHLLLSDGLRSIRLDGPPGAFARPACLSYAIDGLVSAEARLLTLRRFLALCRTRRFSRSLHRREARARRWILILRAWDALAAGASQREIAQQLLSRSVAEPCWRTREPSRRLQVQRLVRSARAFGTGAAYRSLLR